MKFKKGHTPWNKGKKMTKETKEKLSKSLKKAWEDKDWSERNEKVSKALKGRTFSEEHKKSLRENNARYWLGKKMSKETKMKMSNTHKENPYWLGKSLSDQHKQKISRANSGKTQPTEQIKKRVNSLAIFYKSEKPTSIEKKLYDELNLNYKPFEKQVSIHGKFLVDAFIPRYNLIIEADGDYWHSLSEVIKKDRAENAYLEECGYNLLRLSEKEINNGKFRKILKEKVGDIN